LLTIIVVVPKRKVRKLGASILGSHNLEPLPRRRVDAWHSTSIIHSLNSLLNVLAVVISWEFLPVTVVVPFVKFDIDPNHTVAISLLDVALPPVDKVLIKWVERLNAFFSKRLDFSIFIILIAFNVVGSEVIDHCVKLVSNIPFSAGEEVDILKLVTSCFGISQILYHWPPVTFWCLVTSWDSEVVSLISQTSVLIHWEWVCIVYTEDLLLPWCYCDESQSTKY
jgi:hypothetical protein